MERARKVRPAFVKKWFNRIKHATGHFPFEDSRKLSEIQLTEILEKNGWLNVHLHNEKSRALSISPSARFLILNTGFAPKKWDRLSEKERSSLARMVIDGNLAGLSDLSSALKKLNKDHHVSFRNSRKPNTSSVESSIERFISKRKKEVVRAQKQSDEEFGHSFSRMRDETGEDWSRLEYIRRKKNAISIMNGVLEGIRAGRYRP